MAPSKGTINNDKLLDSEYEYEYDETETETFYVDIDLTSTHGLIAPPATKKRKVQFEAPPTSRSTPAPTTPLATASHISTEEPGEGQPPEQVESPIPETPKAPENAARNDLQIVGLDSLNPIISYRGQYFSCTWSDMIGTNLFFTEPTPDQDSISPLFKGDGFDLQAVTRIKLIGQKAKLAARPGRKKRAKKGEENDEDEDITSDAENEVPPGTVMDGKALGTLTSNNPTINKEIKRQANFLERLMDIKRKKGETDNVRTVYTESSREADRRGGIHSFGRPTTTRGNQGRVISRTKEDFAKEIEQLNRRVVRGDRDALFRLEEIYEQMEDEQHSGAAPRPPSPTDGLDEGTPG